MAEPVIFLQKRKLNEAMSALAGVTSFDDLIAILCESGRAIADSDGITVIRRSGDHVTYVAEDAVTPLWMGKSFVIETCISGVALLENQPILISDIYADARVPIAAYLPTFVRSMAMYPIGLVIPTMAVGAYWREVREIDPGTSALLATLARMASIALSRVAMAGSQRHAG